MTNKKTLTKKQKTISGTVLAAYILALGAGLGYTLSKHDLSTQQEPTSTTNISTDGQVQLYSSANNVYVGQKTNFPSLFLNLDNVKINNETKNLSGTKFNYTWYANNQEIAKTTTSTLDLSKSDLANLNLANSTTNFSVKAISTNNKYTLSSSDLKITTISTNSIQTDPSYVTYTNNGIVLDETGGLKPYYENQTDDIQTINVGNIKTKNVTNVTYQWYATYYQSASEVDTTMLSLDNGTNLGNTFTSSTITLDETTFTSINKILNLPTSTTGYYKLYCVVGGKMENGASFQSTITANYSVNFAKVGAVSISDNNNVNSYYPYAIINEPTTLPDMPTIMSASDGINSQDVKTTYAWYEVTQTGNNKYTKVNDTVLSTSNTLNYDESSAFEAFFNKKGVYYFQCEVTISYAGIVKTAYSTVFVLNIVIPTVTLGALKSNNYLVVGGSTSNLKKITPDISIDADGLNSKHYSITYNWSVTKNNQIYGGTSTFSTSSDITSEQLTHIIKTNKTASYLFTCTIHYAFLNQTSTKATFTYNYEIVDAPTLTTNNLTTSIESGSANNISINNVPINTNTNTSTSTYPIEENKQDTPPALNYIVDTQTQNVTTSLNANLTLDQNTNLLSSLSATWIISDNNNTNNSKKITQDLNNKTNGTSTPASNKYDFAVSLDLTKNFYDIPWVKSVTKATTFTITLNVINTIDGVTQSTTNTYLITVYPKANFNVNLDGSSTMNGFIGMTNSLNSIVFNVEDPTDNALFNYLDTDYTPTYTYVFSIRQGNGNWYDLNSPSDDTGINRIFCNQTKPQVTLTPSILLADMATVASEHKGSFSVSAGSYTISCAVQYTIPGIGVTQAVTVQSSSDVTLNLYALPTINNACSNSVSSNDSYITSNKDNLAGTLYLFNLTSIDQATENGKNPPTGSWLNWPSTSTSDSNINITINTTQINTWLDQLKNDNSWLTNAKVSYYYYNTYNMKTNMVTSDNIENATLINNVNNGYSYSFDPLSAKSELGQTGFNTDGGLNYYNVIVYLTYESDGNTYKMIADTYTLATSLVGITLSSGQTDDNFEATMKITYTTKLPQEITASYGWGFDSTNMTTKNGVNTLTQSLKTYFTNPSLANKTIVVKYWKVYQHSYWTNIPQSGNHTQFEYSANIANHPIIFSAATFSQFVQKHNKNIWSSYVYENMNYGKLLTDASLDHFSIQETPTDNLWFSFRLKIQNNVIADPMNFLGYSWQVFLWCPKFKAHFIKVANKYNTIYH